MTDKQIYVHLYSAALTGVIAKGDYQKRNLGPNTTEYASAAGEAKKLADAAFPMVKGRLNHGI